MMTPEQIRTLHARISRILEKMGDEPDHYFACVILSDLSNIPFKRVFKICAEMP